jgi:recombination protein RecA
MGNITMFRAAPAIASQVLSERKARGVGCAPLWEHWGPGQLLEISGDAPGKLSTVASLLRRAQREGEPCAWVSLREGASFYPPDFAQAGVDLAALVVIRVPLTAGSYGVVRASELLLRSGAFGLLVIDFAERLPKGELTWQSRLSGLVRLHEARAVLLTPSRADEPSLGPMVSLRVEPSWRVIAPARVVLSQRVLKSKLGGELKISPDVREPPQGAMRMS